MKSIKTLFVIIYIPIIIVTYLPIRTFAQYAGGNADGHSLVSKTDVATCTLPSYANISTGGNADGHAMVAKTDVATCTLPSYANISTGGNADGHAMVAKTDVAICTLPSYANISTGGNADGHAMLRPLNKAGKDSCFSFTSCSINAIVSNDTSVCSGFVTLTASGGKYYKWYSNSDSYFFSIGNTSSISVQPGMSVPNGVGASIYKVTISNDTCSVDKFIKALLDSRPPVVEFRKEIVVCTGDSVVLIADSSQYSSVYRYKWSTGDTTSSIVVKPTKDDTLKVDIIGGCVTTKAFIPITLFKASSSVKITGDTIICKGGSATLTASGGPNYKWSNGATSETITVNPTQDAIYKVVVTNGNCKDSASITVKVLPTLTADAGADKTVCKGGSVQLNGSGTGTSYRWIPATGLNNDSVVQPIFTDTVSRTYWLTASIGSCQKTDSVTVTLSSLAGNISGNTSLCSGESTTLTANGGTSYSWSTGETTSSITLTPSKDSTVSVTITNGASCTTSATVKVLNVLADAGADKTVCKGSSVQLNGSGTGTSYLWTPATGLNNDTVTQPMFIDSVSKTYVLTVLNGKCKKTDTVIVTVGTLAGTISGNTSLCSGESTTLTASGGISYSWSTGETTASITLTPSKDSTVSVSITDGASCSASVTVKVATYPTSVSAGTDKTICKGNSVQIGSVETQNFVSLQWLPKTGLVQDTILQPTASPVTTTSYILTVANGKCAKTDTVVVTVNSAPNVNAGTDTTIKLGESVTLLASGANTYLWSPVTGLSNNTIANPVAQPTATITYIVIGTDANGCTNSDTIIVIVIEKDSCGEVFIPNAFSPNDNSFNDVFRVRMPSNCLKEIYFVIYDRWGKQVFETDDITKGWNGTHNGKALNTGVFVYYLKATLTDGNEVEQKGNISLIR